MPAIFQDILLAGGGLPGSWVRLVNNLTSTAYVSSAATTGPGGTAGLFSIPNPPPGVYTVYTGPSATGPWTSTGETSFIVPATPTDIVTAGATFIPTNPATTLNGAIDNAVTSIVVASASGFPNPGPFTILIDFEKMRVTAGYGTTTWTVTRAYDQTQAASHLTAAVVACIQTVLIGTGDDVWYALGGRGVARAMDIRQGSAASPNTEGLGPTLKVSRTDSIPEANMPLGIGANFQGNGAIWGASYGDANQQASTNAVIGTAVSVSTQSTHNDDAQGLTGVGSIEGSGTGDGIGGYLVGSRKTTTGSTNALEVRSSNFTAQDDNFLPTTASRTMGGWATAGGNAPSAVAWNVGTFGGAQTWHVGYGAVTGSVTDYFMYDNSGATNGILLAGASRTGFGMAIASGSGPLFVGEVTALSSSSLIEVISANGTGRDPLGRWGSSGASDPYSLRLHNGSGTVYFAFVSGGAGQFLTATATGDAGVKMSTAGKAYHIGGTAKVITVTGGDLLGFFAGTPVAKQSTTGTSTGFTAGAGTTVTDQSTFTGGTGATAYRISDIVLALKNYNLLAA